jgi:hypothetical protein
MSERYVVEIKHKGYFSYMVTAKSKESAIKEAERLFEHDRQQMPVSSLSSCSESYKCKGKV